MVTNKQVENMQYNLQYFRQYFGITMKELGEMIGLTKQSMHSKEHGITRLTKAECLAILYIFEKKDPIVKGFLNKKVKTCKESITIKFEAKS